MLQSAMEKTIKQEFEVKHEDVVNNDTYIGGTYHLDGNGLTLELKVGSLILLEDCNIKICIIIAWNVHFLSNGVILIRWKTHILST